MGTETRYLNRIRRWTCIWLEDGRESTYVSTCRAGMEKRFVLVKAGWMHLARGSLPRMATETSRPSSPVAPIAYQIRCYRIIGVMRRISQHRPPLAWPVTELTEKLYLTGSTNQIGGGRGRDTVEDPEKESKAGQFFPVPRDGLAERVRQYPLDP
jgi:hypothetical protein